MKNETKVVCPNCGAEIAIPEHEHFAAGMCIGKDSGMGTIILPAAETSNKPNKMKKTASEKIAALKAAGVNVDNLFAMNGANGGDAVVRLENGVIQPVADDDPIFKAIMEYGAIPERRLFRRWIASQIMHMMSRNNYYERYNYDFTARIQAHGYMYSWKVAVEELRVQAKLARLDMENYIKYNRGYNKITVAEMAKDFITSLSEYIKGVEVHKCKGREYKKIRGNNVFCDEINSKVMGPMLLAHANIKKQTDAQGLYKAAAEFYKLAKKYQPRWDEKMSTAFINSYKFTGAFFTMENFILFSGCFLWDDNGRKLSKEDSIKYLYAKAEEYKEEGWRLFGLLKKFLDDNDIDPDKKMAEWAEAKRARRA